MSEAMAIEKMAETLANMKGFHATNTNIPYIGKKDKKKQEDKKGSQAGDLDVIGINMDGKTLIIECKAFYSPELYPNWFTNAHIRDIQILVENLATNIDKLLVSNWQKALLKGKEGLLLKPDYIWIVFPGSFYPKQDASKAKCLKDSKKNPVKDFWKKVIKDKDGITPSEYCKYEDFLLREVSEYLSDKYGSEVTLIPIHKMIEELFDLVPSDMMERRVRYSDTSTEMIRWIARAVHHKSLDLNKIQQNIINDKKGLFKTT